MATATTVNHKGSREERTVRILMFDYLDADGNSVSATKGETVELTEEQIECGDDILAFVETVAITDGEGLLDLTTATDDQILEWLQTEEPTVQEVVDASGGDPELADRLLRLEESATGGNARKGVIAGLTAVIERATA